MNNTKTKFIIAISQKLSAAPDSDAKVDLIEELSENLCARYQDMVASGMPEDQAYTAALDKLGDVNELLAYLDCCGEQPSGAGGPFTQDTKDDRFGNLGDMIRQTVDQAMDAASDAATMFWDAVKGFEGSAVNQGGKRVPLRTSDEDKEMEFPSGDLRELRLNIAGDLSVNLNGDSGSPVWLRGDTEDLLVEIDNGVLTVTQDKSAGGSFFFSRGLSSASIELTIPQRQWEKLAFSTASGDLEISDGMLEVGEMSLKTSSGDVSLDSLHVLNRLEVQTASGDLELTDSVCGELVFRSSSGDLEGENVNAAVLAQTASGDVSLTGDIRTMKASSASGDLELNCDLLPENLELATKSGDCSIHLPDSSGFVFRFSTVSGELYSDFPLTADATMLRDRRVGHAGEAYYKDGGDGRVFTLSSVSGDIELRKK